MSRLARTSGRPPPEVVDTTEPTGPPAWSLWRPPLLALGLWLVCATATVLGLWQMRTTTLAREARELALLTGALGDEVERGLSGAEEGLRALRDELEADRANGSPAALKLRTELMPVVRSLWLIDDQRQIESASDDTPTPPFRNFEPPLEVLPTGAMGIAGAPSRLRPGERLVVLSYSRARGSTGAAGRKGWIIAAAPESDLTGAFGGAVRTADAVMRVRRSDGVLLAGMDLGAPAPGEDQVLQLRQIGEAAEDHLVMYRHTSRYQLDIAVARPLAVVLAPWREAARLAAAALLLLALALGAAVLWVLRADRRRWQAQHALQQQLNRAGRLEALGTLAGSVAHDFNNVLAAIVGFGEMAHDAAPVGSHQARHLDRLMQAAHRGQAQADRILRFSRGGARSSRVFELEPVIEEVLGLLGASLQPGLVLERSLGATGARLRGDPTRVVEALLNLCNNGLQAMPGGGVLLVTARRESVAVPRVLSHSRLGTGEWLALSVADQGPGIAPQVMDHLFEPFFTTRGATQGTGLGLAVVHGVVAEFGGAIDVAGTPTARPRGARFTIYLPECMDPADPAPAPATPWAAGRGQAIAVVDDDALVAESLCAMLLSMGYAPELFASAAELLDHVAQRPRRFAAVLTDEVMPHMGGTTLAQRLHALQADLPVLLLSGYGGPGLAERAAAAGVNLVLTKPVARAELARALSRWLAPGAEVGAEVAADTGVDTGTVTDQPVQLRAGQPANWAPRPVSHPPTDPDGSAAAER